MHLDVLLADLATVFFAGVVSVLTLGRLGLPPVVGFLVAGLVIGPAALGLVDDRAMIEALAELGVALLLFTIGLELSLDRLRRIGRLVAIGGGLQVGLTIAASIAGALALGATAAEGAVWGFLAAVSSTAIALRLLADRGEVDAPHGRLVVGVLIFQDLAIVPMMLAVPVLAGGGSSPLDLALVLGKAAGVIAAVIAAARLVVPPLLGLAARARSREVFVLTILMVAAAVAWATSSAGLSIALGAFLAGVAVAETEFVHQAHAEVSPLRDALASLFFMSVGMLLDPAVLLTRPAEVAGLVALLVFAKLVIAALAVLLMRLPARVALLSGVALAQVGEFSFVLLESARGEGLISADAAATFLAASVVTMIAAPLLVAWSPRLAAGAPLLQPLERLLASRPLREDAPAPAPRDHVVVAGLGLGGRVLVDALEAARVPYVAIELNPETVIAERAAGRDVRYGDVTSEEVLERVAHVASARQVVLLLSDVDAARRAARTIRRRHPDLPVLVRVHRLERDTDGFELPGVQVVAEDHQTALDVVELVLRGAPRSDASPLAEPPPFSLQVATVAPWAAGRTLAELDLWAGVVALARDGAVLPSPDPGEALRSGDALFLAGTPEQVAQAASRVERAPAAGQPRGAPESRGRSYAIRFDVIRYGLAVAVPLVVTGLLAFVYVTVGVPFLALFAGAALVPAVVGGRWPGLVAAGLSFVLANMTFVEPRGELTLEARMLPLLLLCVVPVMLVESARRAGAEA